MCFSDLQRLSEIYPELNISDGGSGVIRLYDIDPAADSVKQEAFTGIMRDRDSKPANKLFTYISMA